MSVELIDLRAKITPEAFCAIAAYARAHDVDKAEVAREVLHRWAIRQIHGARMLTSCLRAKGMAREAEGIVRNDADTLKWDEA